MKSNSTENFIKTTKKGFKTFKKINKTLINSLIKKRSLYSKKMLKYKIYLIKLMKSNSLSEKIITLAMEPYLEILIQSEKYREKKVYRLLNLEARIKTKRKILKEAPVNKLKDDLTKLIKFTDFSCFFIQ